MTTDVDVPVETGVTCSACGVFKLDSEFHQSKGKDRETVLKEHVVSWSEVSTFRACPHKHMLSYIERWTQPQTDNTPLGKGTMWHLVLEEHYTAVKEGRNHKQAVYDLLDSWRRGSRDTDVIALLEWMYAGHLESFGTDEQWEIIAIEFPFVFSLSRPDGTPTRFKLKGKIDLVVRDRSNLRVSVVDHKSCGNLPKDRELDLDDQMGLYLWGLRSLGYKPFNAIYSAARTAMLKGDKPGALETWERAKAAGEKPGARPKQQELSDRFSRTQLTRTDIELDNIARETLDTAESMYGASNNHERHTDTDRCRWMCSYTEACLIGRKTSPERERVFLGDVGFVQDYTRH